MVKYLPWMTLLETALQIKFSNLKPSKMQEVKMWPRGNRLFAQLIVQGTVWPPFTESGHTNQLSLIVGTCRRCVSTDPCNRVFGTLLRRIGFAAARNNFVVAVRAKYPVVVTLVILADNKSRHCFVTSVIFPHSTVRVMLWYNKKYKTSFLYKERLSGVFLIFIPP